MMNKAIQGIKKKAAQHIDARDTEYAVLLPDGGIQVEGTPAPYPSDKVVFAEYLLDRKVEAYFQISEYMEGEEAKGSVTGVLANGTEYESGAQYQNVARSSLKGTLVIPSPLKPGDKLIVSRIADQRYYVHGRRDVEYDGG
jgi:hypothetical protein